MIASFGRSSCRRPLPSEGVEPIETVRAIRDDIRARVAALVSANGWAR